MTIFCTLYYFFSYIQIVPQIGKLIKIKTSNDYSLGMITLQLISVISWSLYIFTPNQNIVVYIGTVIDLLLIIFIDLLILRYYIQQKNPSIDNCLILSIQGFFKYMHLVAHVSNSFSS